VGLDRLILLALVLGVVTSCGGDGPPRLLFDGTRAGPPPPQFPEDAVASRVEILSSTDLPDALRSSCPGLRAGVDVVRRTGVAGGSLTFHDLHEAGLLACDAAPGEYELAPWCGVSAGRLYAGRLRDPRLDLCQSRDGRLTGFVWIEPRSDARWIGVDQGSFTEIYVVAGDLPVRIASTRDVELAGSRASFDVTQYSAEGRELGKTRVEAAVAG
jgi:hypothetical protein